jgi:PEP-CTERM motif-containing protein
MSVSKPVILTVLAACALGALNGSQAAPAALPPGGTVNPIPVYDGTGTPTHDILADTGLQSATSNGMTVQFEEWAVSTNLNPGGVVFAFAITTSNNPTSLGATLPGYSGFMTSVESCDPFSSLTSCGTATGMTTRSSGTGDTLSFGSLGTTAVTPPIGSPVWASNLYGVFTNASGWVDPQVTVIDDGSSFMFDGIAPKSTASAPEPATLGLLALGLLGTSLARRKRRR